MLIEDPVSLGVGAGIHSSSSQMSGKGAAVLKNKLQGSSRKRHREEGYGDSSVVVKQAKLDLRQASTEKEKQDGDSTSDQPGHAIDTKTVVSVVFQSETSIQPAEAAIASLSTSHSKEAHSHAVSRTPSPTHLQQDEHRDSSNKKKRKRRKRKTMDIAVIDSTGPGNLSHASGSTPLNVQLTVEGSVNDGSIENAAESEIEREYEDEWTGFHSTDEIVGNGLTFGREQIKATTRISLASGASF